MRPYFTIQISWITKDILSSNTVKYKHIIYNPIKIDIFNKEYLIIKQLASL